MKITSRLDYWLISEEFLPFVVSADIRPMFRSDHNAISLKIRTMKSSKVPGYWKLNVSLLKDESYKVGIRNIIMKCKNYKELGFAMKWKMVKIKCREFSQKFSVRKSMNSVKTSVLENRLKVLDMKLIDGDLNSLYE